MEIVDIVVIIISVVGVITGIVIVSRIVPYLKSDNKDDDESTSETQFIEIDGQRYELVPAEPTEPTSEPVAKVSTATDNKRFIEIDGQRYELVPAEE